MSKHRNISYYWNIQILSQQTTQHGKMQKSIVEKVRQKRGTTVNSDLAYLASLYLLS